MEKQDENSTKIKQVIEYILRITNEMKYQSEVRAYKRLEEVENNAVKTVDRYTVALYADGKFLGFYNGHRIRQRPTYFTKLWAETVQEYATTQMGVEAVLRKVKKFEVD